MGWDNERVRQALDRHESGDFRESADLVEALLTDERLDGALQQRIDGLLALPLAFEPSTEVGDAELAGEVARQALEVWWRICPEQALRDILKWLIMLGVAVVQVNWTHERGQELPIIEVWHARDLWFDGHDITYKVNTTSSQVPLRDSAGKVEGGKSMTVLGVYSIVQGHSDEVFSEIRTIMQDLDSVLAYSWPVEVGASSRKAPGYTAKDRQKRGLCSCGGTIRSHR